LAAISLRRRVICHSVDAPTLKKSALDLQLTLGPSKSQPSTLS
jgi:hypothetical protein